MKKNDWQWPAGITLAILLFVGFLLLTFVLASRQPVNLVAVDYYDSAVQHQSHIDRVDRTRALAAKIDWQYDAGAREIMLIYPPEWLSDGKITGTITLYRPSNAALDRSWSIAATDQARQPLDVSELQSGFWRLKITWRMHGQDYFWEHDLMLLE